MHAGDFTIEPVGACAQTLASLAEVHCRTPLTWNPDWVVDPEAVTATRALMARQLRDETGSILMATRAGQVAGMIWAFDLASTGHPCAREDAWHIASLWVSPESEGLGLGQRLVSTLEDQARRIGLQHLTSQVHQRNARMLGLNRHLGYHKSSRDDQWVYFDKTL